MSELSIRDIEKLAKLARLHLRKDEIEMFRKEFTEILNYVDQLAEVDTSNIKPTYQVTGLSNVTRRDVEIDYGANQESLMMNVPNYKNSHIQVKRMLG